MKTPSLPVPASSASIAVKLFIVGIMIVMLLVPALLIYAIVFERQGRRDEAVGSIHRAWSRDQVLSGPILLVPVRVPEKDEKGKLVQRVVTARILPETLDIQGSIETETRQRGIYKTAVYTTDLEISGHFGKPDLERLGLGGGEALWRQAALAVGISDPRGLKETVTMEFAGKSLPMEPGAGAASELGAGLNARLPAGVFQAPQRAFPFSFRMKTRGSQSLFFSPLAKTTTVSLASAWPSPSFSGAFLPETREVGEDGFKAVWKVLDLNRSLPQSWAGETSGVFSSNFGVELLVTVDHYKGVLRAVKYAVLFIFFTFLTFFFVEFFGDKPLHPIQYLLVGSAVVLFYLLLLSFAEYVSFPLAYVLAALAVLGLIGGYTRAVFKQPKTTGTVTSILASLYVYLYILLQLEDYALILGSLGLLLALGLVMYLTRKIDWYGAERKPAG